MSIWTLEYVDLRHRARIDSLESALAIERARVSELLQVVLDQAKPEHRSEEKVIPDSLVAIPTKVEMAILARVPRRAPEFQVMVDWAAALLEADPRSVDAVIAAIEQGQDVDDLLATL